MAFVDALHKVYMVNPCNEVAISAVSGLLVYQDNWFNLDLVYYEIWNGGKAETNKREPDGNMLSSVCLN